MSTIHRIGRIARNRYIVYSLAVGVAAIALALRFRGLGRSLWLDEAWVANSIAAPSLADMFYYPAWLQTSPPLFLVIARIFVSVFGLANWTFRAAPALMGFLSLAFMAVLAARLLPRAYALLAWTLFALSHFAIVYSTTLKQYSGELAASTAVLLTTVAYLQMPKSRQFQALVTTAVVGLLAAYPVAFALPGVLLVVCLSSFRRALILAASAGVTLAAEYLFLISRNTSPALFSAWALDTTNVGFSRFASSAAYNLLSLLPIPGRLMQPLLLEVLAVAGFALACSRFWKGRRKWLEIQVLCAAPCLLLAIGMWFSWYAMSIRTSLFILPFLVILIVTDVQLILDFLIARWNAGWIRPLLPAGLIAFTLLTIYAGVRQSPIRALETPEEDMASAVSFLHQRVKPNDLLWVHASASEGFNLYKKMLGWSDPPAKYGQTGWPCCPRGVDLVFRASSEEAVQHDVDNGIPRGFMGRIWLLYTTRPEHWWFVGLDESQITRDLLRERGCVETPAPAFRNIGISSFDCSP